MLKIWWAIIKIDKFYILNCPLLLFTIRFDFMGRNHEKHFGQQLSYFQYKSYCWYTHTKLTFSVVKKIHCTHQEYCFVMVKNKLTESATIVNGEVVSDNFLYFSSTRQISKSTRSTPRYKEKHPKSNTMDQNRFSKLKYISTYNERTTYFVDPSIQHLLNPVL